MPTFFPLACGSFTHNKCLTTPMQQSLTIPKNGRCVGLLQKQRIYKFVIKMKYIGIIPARYSSSRFPGKPLAKLGGKIIIQRVYERASSVLDEVYVATDDSRIFDAVASFGGLAIMTSSNHRSGTDRICEAVNKISPTCDAVINIQGDEPFISAEQIREVCDCFNDADTQIATLGKPFGNDIEAIKNPNSPKIVVDNKGFALYFSRSVIPFVRGTECSEWPTSFPFLKHIGLYGYRKCVLDEIARLPQSPLEIAESLEQLRWLQNGYKIKVGHTDIETIGIDTPNDLARAEAFLAEHGE